MQDRLPSAVDVSSEVEVSLAYKCHYRLEYQAFLMGQHYKTPEGQAIVATPISEKNGWKYCPKGYVSDLKVHQDSIQSNKKEHDAEGSIYAGPIKLPKGQVKIHTEQPPRLNQPVDCRTSVLGFSILGRSRVTPAAAPVTPAAKPAAPNQ